MTTISSQITSLTVVYSTVYSDTDKKKHQSSASLAFVWGIHRYRWIPRTKGQLRGKCFHLMTSSWLFKRMTACCWLHQWDQRLVKFCYKWNNIHSRKWNWKCRLQSGGYSFRSFEFHLLFHCDPACRLSLYTLITRLTWINHKFYNTGIASQFSSQ